MIKTFEINFSFQDNSESYTAITFNGYPKEEAVIRTIANKFRVHPSYLKINAVIDKEYEDAQEHIQFENMCFTYFHSFYSQYGYKSIGMILRLIHTYCNLNMAEHHSVGDGKIFYFGNEKKVFATYTWDDEKQIAILDFKDGFSESVDNYREHQRVFLKGLENGWKHF